MAENNIEGITRFKIISDFNSWFLNQAWYKKQTKHPFGLIYESNREYDNYLEEDVLYMCMQTDIVKQLGLSFVELMKLDYATYSRIRDVVFKEVKRKHEQTEKLQKETEAKQQEIIGDLNGKRN